MKTLNIPFRMDERGRLSESRTPAQVLMQHITDLLVTNHFERFFLITHGANLTGFLFSPMLEVLMAPKADEARKYLSINIQFGEIVDVQFRPHSVERTTVDVFVRFRVGPGGDVLSVTRTFTGVVTEESDL